ncbi:unnamed protein product [Adineta steineri]|uniref:BRCT domain-containing protein n=1 Tax=Adineta steineri TaxID=433720 RepID=A0A813SZR5_9BILA|nr:unnamed protein product [Adineta steineri]CAF4037922.1 unnamed protein product [Adineta steineri]
MPSSSIKKKTGSSNITRPSLIDTMLLTSTPLRRSPAIQSTTTSTRSATNLTLQQIFKEKNQTYEDMQLLNLTKNMNKKDKKSTSINKNVKQRSKTRKTLVAAAEDDDDETENDEEIRTRKKPVTNKRKTILSKQQQQQLEEPISKKLRRNAVLDNNKRIKKTPIGKSSAGSSDGCTTGDEENEETRLIEQSKLYIEGPGIRQNHKKINEHNSKIGEKIQSLRSHQPALPSPILSRSATAKQDVVVAPAQSSSPVKIKTASRITFALPAPSASPNPTNIFDSTHPPSPQMPPTTTATSIDTQTDNFSRPACQEKQCQTGSIGSTNQTIQTDSINPELVSIGIQYQSDLISQQHILCRDLTVCACVEQIVKTRQFLVDTSTKFQSAPVSIRSTKVSKQTMTVEESSPTIMVLAKSSLKAEQQIIFEQFISQFNVRYSNTVDETTTHLITDSLDENTPLVCPLTLKVIQATARHLPIISIQWLVASITHQIIVPSQIYEIFLGDPTYGYHGGFLRSRIPRSQGLFQGITFLLECPEQHACPAILADNRALRELIYLCSGTIADELNSNQSSTIIVLCNEIKQKDQLYTAYVKPEWLLASIAQYNLQPFQQFSVNFTP